MERIGGEPMKRLALWWSVLLVLASPSYAAVHSGTGTVYILQLFDSAYGADVDWFALSGVSSLGACKTTGPTPPGYVVFRLRDNPKGQRMFTVVLAAKASNTPLTVFVDDTVTDGAGYCYVQYL
jgi:hypothetical protein